ncbi:MAG: hypothetical protein EOM65_17160 [Synergistales bacterium]|nr:hypothetical protein [Synergistales bacterium]
MNDVIHNYAVNKKLRIPDFDKKVKEKETRLNELQFEAKKMLELVMEGAIAQGSTYKNKMATLETEIAINVFSVMMVEKFQSSDGKFGSKDNGPGQAQGSLFHGERSFLQICYSSVRLLHNPEDRSIPEAAMYNRSRRERERRNIHAVYRQIFRRPRHEPRSGLRRGGGP